MSAMVGFHTRSLRVTTTAVSRFLREKERDNPQHHSVRITAVASQCHWVNATAVSGFLREQERDNPQRHRVSVSIMRSQCH